MRTHQPLALVRAAVWTCVSLCVCVLLVLPGRVHVSARSGGNPSCSLLPSHGASPQAGSGPYSLSTAANSWSSGTPVQLTLNVASGSPGFHGLMLIPGSGSWSAIPGALQPICGNALTHRTPTPKGSITLTWTPPAAGSGAVTFQACVLSDFFTFYIISLTLAEQVVPPCPTAVPGSPCSGHGTCVQLQIGNIVPNCQCDAGFLGKDCSRAAANSKALVFPGGLDIGYTISWTVDITAAKIYVQLRGRTAGWLGFMLKKDPNAIGFPSPGMDEGDIWVVDVNDVTGVPTATDRWSVTNIDLSNPLSPNILGGLPIDGSPNDLVNVCGHQAVDPATGQTFTSVNFERALVTADCTANLVPTRDKPILSGPMYVSFAFDESDDFRQHLPTHRAKDFITFYGPTPVAPTKPLPAVFESATDTTVSISWTRPAYPPNALATAPAANEALTGFAVQIATGSGAGVGTFAPAAGCTGLNAVTVTCTISGLSASETYSVRFAGINGVGTGSFSDAVVVTTTALGAALPDDPLPPTLGFVRNSVAEFKWIAPDLHGVALVRYELLLSFNNSATVGIVYRGTATAFNATQLLPGFTYAARVRVLSLAGFSNFSSPELNYTVQPFSPCPGSPTPCSGNGVCDDVTRFCRCAPGFLDVDCSKFALVTETFPNPRAPTSAAVTLRWLYDATMFYGQIEWVTRGYVALMVNHGTAGGMSPPGDCWVFQILPNTGQQTEAAVADDRFAIAGNIAPQRDSRQDLVDVFGYHDDGVGGTRHGFVNFRRARDTGDSNDAVLAGPLRTAYALADFNAFQYHGPLQGRTIVDWSPPVFVGPPRPPVSNNPTALFGTNTSLVIRWAAPLAQGSNPIIGYIISRNDGGSSGVYTVIGTSSVLSTTFSVTGLMPATTYSFQVMAFSASGNGTAVTFSAQTLSEYALPPEAPTLGLAFATGRSLGITWTPGSLFGAQLIAYTVSIQPLDLSQPSRVVFSDYADGVTVPYAVTISNGTLDNTNYTVSITCQTLAGTSAVSSRVFATTALGDCENACGVANAQGACVSGSCQCAFGGDRTFLGRDCSVGPANELVLSSQLTMYFLTVDSTRLYVGLLCTDASMDWVSVMLNPGSSGMSGDTWIAWSNGVMEHREGVGQTTPRYLSTASFVDVTSYRTQSGGFFVSFYRLLVVPNGDVTKDQPITAGDTPISFAAGRGTPPPSAGAQGFPGQHGASLADRGKASVDFTTGASSVVGTIDQRAYVPWGVALAVCVLTAAFFRPTLLQFTSAGVSLLRSRPFAAYAPEGGEPTTGCGCRRLFNAVTFDVFPALIDLTWGELGVWVMYAAGFIGYLIYASMQYDRAQRDFIFAIGHLTTVHLGLATLPVTRNSVWLPVFGISFERAIKWHRWWARIAYILMTVHGATMQYRFGWNVIVQTNATPEGLGNLYGVLCWLCTTLMFITALEPIRRRWFETFLYTHFLFLGVWVFAMLHSGTAIAVVIGPVMLWVVDRAIRFVRSRQSVTVVSATVLTSIGGGKAGAGRRVAGDRVVVLTVYKPFFWYEAGQFVFVRVAALGSSFDWHPFSISSHVDPRVARATEGDTFTLHISDMGPGTWTHELANLVAKGSGSSGQLPGQVYVDGPHGSLSVPVFEYRACVLVCGGIGATPLIAVLGEILTRLRQNRLKRLEAVHLVWVCRDTQPFVEWFPEVMSMAQSAGGIVKLHLFATGQKEPVTVMTTPRGVNGVLDSVAAAATPSAVGSGSSGIDAKQPAGTELAVLNAKPLSPGVNASASASVRAPGVAVQPVRLSVTPGRPPALGALFASLTKDIAVDDAGGGGAAQVAVLACGPASLVADTQRVCSERGYHLHKETFFF